MKTLGVAALIRGGNKYSCLLLGRRNKEPNKGLYVLPGGGVEANESLEEALKREIKEETGLIIEPETNRWYQPYIIQLPDRVILVVEVIVEDETPISGDDLYDVAWFSVYDLPADISPVVVPVLIEAGLLPRKKSANIAI